MRFAAPTAAAATLMLIASVPALAQPPRSCVHKFTGMWKQVSGPPFYLGATIYPDGSAVSRCSGAICWPRQFWMCNGDTYIITGPTPGQAQLIGRQLAGHGSVLVREGGGRRRRN